jgi:hypothetical protein
MDPALARSLWHRLETINAVTYFSPECREAPARLGLVGSWMELYLRSRGWSAEDWEAARERLAARDLVAPDGTATAAGRRLREDVERRTDELAAAPYRQLPAADVDRLLALLAPAAARIAASGDIWYPNPMGLPRSRPD